MTPRVVVTADAAALLDQLREQHGPLMFHQSGGCCDGSSPMCYPDGDFIVGDRDVLLGVLDVGADGVSVWISGPQFEAWKHTQLVIDVVPGPLGQKACMPSRSKNPRLASSTRKYSRSSAAMAKVIPASAISIAANAIAAPVALRKTHGSSTSPPSGSQTRPSVPCCASATA